MMWPGGPAAVIGVHFMAQGASLAGTAPDGMSRERVTGPGDRRQRMSPRVRRDLRRLAQHQPSHRQLLAPVDPRPMPAGRRGTIDVIVVPTSRPFTRSRPAMVEAFRLARRHDARVLVLCSGDAKAAQFPADLSNGK